MWSDKSGRHSATKESIRLPSSAWQWVSDWAVDYYTPGGVDKSVFLSKSNSFMSSRDFLNLNVRKDCYRSQRYGYRYSIRIRSWIQFYRYFMVAGNFD